MRVLIPLAGSNPFFKIEDYYFPKPLIDIAGRPMIQWAVENLRTLGPDAHFVFVANVDDIRRFSLDEILRQCTDGRFDLVGLQHPTAGALCSCLMAIDHIVDDEPLIIANGDQIIETDLSQVLTDLRRQAVSGGVVTFESRHPRWSYVRTDDSGAVIQVAEKRVIGHEAIAGFYYFARGADFIDVAMESIDQDQQTDEQYYIAPSLNQLILRGENIGRFPIPAEAYHSFYSPQKVSEFERLLQSREIATLSRQGTGHEAPVQTGLTVVIPMAGMGSRFAKAGYSKPKPFIDVLGKPMIEQVIDNLQVPGAEFVLLARREHIEAEQALIDDLCKRYPITLLPVDQLTEGTACTVLLGRKQIDHDRPLLIANSDQLVDFNCAAYIGDCLSRGLDGSILVFNDVQRDPKWSFARIDAEGLVEEVAEKKPISDLATVGIYFFRQGSDFVDAAIDMIAVNDRVNNEFYTCPVYNYLIRNGRRVGVYEVPAEAMHGLGTPEDLDAYLAIASTA